VETAVAEFIEERYSKRFGFDPVDHPHVADLGSTQQHSTSG